MQKDVIYKAGILTSLIFIIGILVGMWLDSIRAENVKEEFEEISINWNDATLQNLYYQTFNISGYCDSAIESNLEFADKVYERGLEIEKYEEVNKFSKSLITQKKKYVLLKLQFWFNSINIKKHCDADYTNVVYFYSHYAENKMKIDQKTQGAVLSELKSKCGNKIMLIPLPIDLDITTIDAIKDQYNITKTPTILIDEKIKLEGIQGMEDLEKYIEC